MDHTVKLLLDKVTQLTNRFNSLTQNSKKIHELGDAEFSGEVFIAVSDGTNTGKVIYKPSEVSQEEFDNISNMDLSTDSETYTLFIKDSEGNVIASTNLSELFSGITTKNVTISEEGQTVVPDANQNIIRFAGLVTGTTIQPGIKNGDQLVLINKSTAETPFNINIPVILKSSAEADVFSVKPNTNYMFLFDQSINRWIDVTIEGQFNGGVGLDFRLANLASDLNDEEKTTIRQKLGITNTGGFVDAEGYDLKLID